MRRARFFGGPILLLVLAGIGVMGVIVRALWNALVPPVFGGHTITYWQATGLFVLARLLFGRFGGPPFRRPKFVRGWSSLTPEERERFRRGMCGTARTDETPERV